MMLTPWFRTSLAAMIIDSILAFSPPVRTAHYHSNICTTSKINLVIIFSPTTMLHAKKWFPLPLNPFSLSKNNNGLEAGYIEETVLLLSNKKRKEDFKDEMSLKFPLIPSPIIDLCLDSLTDSFSNVAPSELKKALQPGGLKKFRPGLEARLVKSLQKNSKLGSLPSTTLTYLVSLALDYVLKDMEELLADPDEKLQALEKRQRQIERYMSRWQLMSYRIRYHPAKTAMAIAATGLTGVALVRWCQHLAITSTRFREILHVITPVLLAVYSTIVSFVQVAVAKVTMLIGTASEAVKKNA